MRYKKIGHLYFMTMIYIIHSIVSVISHRDGTYSNGIQLLNGRRSDLKQNVSKRYYNFDPKCFTTYCHTAQVVTIGVAVLLLC